MINICTGKPGQGKTAYLVFLAWKFLQQGRDIYSNFYINFDLLIDKLPDHKKKKLGKIIFWDTLDELINIRGGQILIDECQIYFNSRGWKNLPPRLQYKFQQHRKHRGLTGQSLDIWGAVQNVKRIDTVVRELVNSIHQCKRVGKLVMVREYDIEEIDNVKKVCYGRKYFWIGKKITSSYDTYQEINGFGSA